MLISGSTFRVSLCVGSAGVCLYPSVDLTSRTFDVFEFPRRYVWFYPPVFGYEDVTRSPSMGPVLYGFDSGSTGVISVFVPLLFISGLEQCISTGMRGINRIF